MSLDGKIEETRELIRQIQKGIEILEENKKALR